jgi:hypothetical protein
VQIDQQSDEAVRPELTPGETVLWAGQPNTSVIFHKEDAFLVPFSLLWGGFAIFWEVGVSGYWDSNFGSGKPWIFGMLFGAAFVLTGQYFIWGRFLVTAWKKRRTYYAVTNHRVIVVQQGLSRKMASAYIDTLPNLIKEERRRGLGSLLFTQPRPLWFRTGGWGAWDSMAIGDMPEFRDVNDVDSIYRLVSDQREQLRRAATIV